MPPPRALSLKKNREDEEEVVKCREHSRRSRADRYIDKTRPYPSLFPLGQAVAVIKARKLPPSPSRVRPPLHLPPPQFSIYSSRDHPAKEKKKKYFPGFDSICKVDRWELEKGLSAHKKVHLSPLFKLTSVDGKSVEDLRNFPEAPRVITFIKDTGVSESRGLPI